MLKLWFAGGCKFEIHISALKASIAMNEASILKITIKQHYESDKPLIKAKFTSLDQPNVRKFLDNHCLHADISYKARAFGTAY